MRINYLFCTVVSLIISVTTYSQFTTLLDFEINTYGSSPRGDLFYDGTFLYGMTGGGGANSLGTIFKIMPDGTGYERLLDFDGYPKGAEPYGSLISDGTFLYGMTTSGGGDYDGTIFKIMPDGSGYMKLLDFEQTTTGKNPNGSLIYDGTYLYGMTISGGSSNMGKIFKILPDGTGFTTIRDFNGGTDGSSPKGSLFFDGTFLYGMTYFGGTNGRGTIFKIMPDGIGYVKLLSFAGTTDGENPIGSLIYDGTYLYGMTSIGGAENEGTIFKIMPNGTGYMKLLDFTGLTNGRWPFGSLISDGNFLYGMTKNGGANGIGTIFKIMTDGTGYLKLLDFNGTPEGRNPMGNLLKDGSFLYGMTYYGGTNNSGLVFKYELSDASTETYVKDEFVVYPNPSTGIINIATSFDGVQFVSINNILGEMVFKEEMILVAGKSFTLDIGDIPSGVYFLRIGNSIQKMIYE